MEGENEIEYQISQENRIKELEHKIDRLENIVLKWELSDSNPVLENNPDDDPDKAPPKTARGNKLWVQFVVRGALKEWKDGNGWSVPIVYGAKGEWASLGVWKHKKTVQLVQGCLYRAFVNIKKEDRENDKGEMKTYTTLFVEEFDTNFKTPEKTPPASAKKSIVPEQQEIFRERPEPPKEAPHVASDDEDVPF